jgi:hypothetical protein
MPFRDVRRDSDAAPLRSSPLPRGVPARGLMHRWQRARPALRRKSPAPELERWPGQ